MSNRLRPVRFKYSPIKNAEGKYFRCPNCGFILDMDRTSTPERANIAITDEYVYSDLSTMPDADKICTMETPGMIGNAMKLMQDGNPQDVYYTARSYSPNAGCAFCGQVNLVR